jgi:predicted O-methyltransferase YrrM
VTTISIITPWKNGSDTLLKDYAAAIPSDIQIVTVDNASDESNAQALEAFTTERGGVYLRNDENKGFAAANNQGYAQSTGDIVIFLNSDITADPKWLQSVAHDVTDGALYGPSLAQQMLFGEVWPYIEGWCIAATRKTWDRVGVWNAVDYPTPYWEDNDLSLRALEENVKLVQTAWPIQHKGGQTAGPLRNHAESFEHNRELFMRRLARVASDRRAQPITPMFERYVQYANSQNDIQHHLPLLYALSSGNVVELGTRTGVSTAALLAGVERNSGHVWSVDVDPQSAQVAAGHPAWTFIQASSTDLSTVKALKKALPCDLLLIDTLHTEDHVTAELSIWASHVKPGGTICIHDTETFPGVRVAAEAFCTATGWRVTFVRPCNGMAVIEVPR